MTIFAPLPRAWPIASPPWDSDPALEQVGEQHGNHS